MRLVDARSIFEQEIGRFGHLVLVVEFASLFAELLSVGFGLFARWVDLLTNLGRACRCPLAQYRRRDTAYRMRERSTNLRKPAREGQPRERLSMQTRIHERSVSTANKPLIVTFV
jgi:hypothetical protein